MLERLLLTAIAFALVSTFLLQPSPAEAAGMRGMACKDAAKAKYPDGRAMRLPGENCASRTGSYIRADSVRSKAS